MKIVYSNKPSFKLRTLINKTYRYARKMLGQPRNIMVELVFVNEEDIKSLNAKFRNIDKKTDVLSFPMLDIKYGTRLDNSYLEFNEKTIMLGTIYICYDVAVCQAEEYDHSIEREVAFLALHGFLHLLGYDHIEKQDEEIMMLISKKILDRMKLSGGEKNG